MEFIYECDDVFPVDFCNRVIDKFEKSNLKFKGTIGDSITSSIKQSTDLRMYDEPEWVEEEKYFHDMIRKAMKKYETFLLKMDVDDEVKKQMSELLMNTYIHPPQIQRTEPNEYYHWHHDQSRNSNWKLFTYIIYLNDVEEDSGGTTEFSCGKNIQPKAGKIIFFPSTWTYFHRGKTLEKGIKYIATNGLTSRPIREISLSRREMEQRKYPFIISSK
tara:strand:+ start:66 stop:716 length:651 start_codon:yes stop_codon:yes gene_type:complete